MARSVNRHPTFFRKKRKFFRKTGKTKRTTTKVAKLASKVNRLYRTNFLDIVTLNGGSPFAATWSSVDFIQTFATNLNNGVNTASRIANKVYISHITFNVGVTASAKLNSSTDLFRVVCVKPKDVGWMTTNMNATPSSLPTLYQEIQDSNTSKTYFDILSQTQDRYNPTVNASYYSMSQPGIYWLPKTVSVKSFVKINNLVNTGTNAVTTIAEGSYPILYYLAASTNYTIFGDIRVHYEYS